MLTKVNGKPLVGEGGQPLRHYQVSTLLAALVDDRDFTLDLLSPKAPVEGAFCSASSRVQISTGVQYYGVALACGTGAQYWSAVLECST